MPITIRVRLLLLVLGVLIPGAMGMGWLLTDALRAERAAHERTLADTARALSMVVDRELEHRAAVVRVLAQTRWLDAGAAVSAADLRGFEQLVRRSIKGLEGWVELRTADQVLLDTRRPVDTTEPRANSVPLSTTPEVRPLIVDPGPPHASVVQPIERDGRVVMNLVLTLMPSELQRMLNAQKLPANWIGTVMDSRGSIVARHPGGSTYVGRMATHDMRERITLQTPGLFHSVSLDGKDMVGYFSMSPQGWSYASAMPNREFSGVITQVGSEILTGSVAVLALPLLGALWVARRILMPVQTLKSAAMDMKSGRPVRYAATGVVEFDEVAHVLADAATSLQDHRVELERQVSAAVARTRQAEQRVSKSQREEALGRLTGGVAHDFNNLLGVISNSLHLIERHCDKPQTAMPIAAIRRSIETGSQLTQHLLRFAGRRSVRPKVLKLQAWLPELQELLGSVMGRRIQTTVRVSPDTAAVRVDAGELELALVNLALNARDAMKREGTLRVTARNAADDEVDGLAGVPEQRYVLISVCDDGAGIPPELVTRVFEPFFTTKGVGQGSGLGLSQVHGFCVQANGVARLTSTPGLGTAVTLLLPATTGNAMAPELRLEPPSVAGLRLLLVEDNDELGAVTAELLRSHGVNVLAVSSAEDALRVLALPTFVDAVLTDVVMPGALDGLQLARQIRADYPSLPVLLISGFNSGAASQEFVVLRKPCAPQELLQALHEAANSGPPRAPES